MDGTRDDSRITSAVAHMHSHLAEPLAISQLAALVNLSPARFRHLFKAQYGVGPSQYLQNLRLRRARVLIERTFLSVKEVMALVGYNDPSHFSRDFRRVHGVSPSELRRPGTATSPAPAPASSSETPSQRRTSRPRARDPGRRCA
jgi:AraC family transcriptional regulator of arabinose operon